MRYTEQQSQAGGNPGKRPYVCLYTSYLETLAPFSDGERGRIFTAMLAYAATGEEPAFSGNERFLWPWIREQLNRDAAAYGNRCSRSQRRDATGEGQETSPETEELSREPTAPQASPEEALPLAAQDMPEAEEPEASFPDREAEDPWDSPETEGFFEKPKKAKEKEKEKEKEKKKEKEKENAKENISVCTRAAEPPTRARVFPAHEEKGLYHARAPCFVPP